MCVWYVYAYILHVCTYNIILHMKCAYINVCYTYSKFSIDEETEAKLLLPSWGIYIVSELGLQIQLILTLIAALILLHTLTKCYE